MTLWLLQVARGAQVMTCLLMSAGWLDQALAADLTLALPLLLILPSWGKSAYPQKGRHPEQPPALPGHRCHKVAMAVPWQE